ALTDRLSERLELGVVRHRAARIEAVRHDDPRQRDLAQDVALRRLDRVGLLGHVALLVSSGPPRRRACPRPIASEACHPGRGRAGGGALYASTDSSLASRAPPRAERWLNAIRPM